MLGNEISDYKTQRIMQEYGNKHLNLKEKVILKSLLKCGKVVVSINHSHAVAVIANKTTARYVGLNSCKSPWCCPVCSARQMAKYAAKIACALDALKLRKQSAAMFTFTIPHTSGFTCEQTTEILYNVWKAFTVHGNKVLAASPNDVFSNFAATFNHKHTVRVCEYTWGSKGWHPHFHCLLWFPSDRIDEILDWEERLNKRWLELCKRYTIKQLLLGYPETQRKTVRAQVNARVNIMYSKMDTANSKGCYISKDKGKVIVQQSSDYLCGWGGNREVTGNVSLKATHPNHYTWQQILENAIKQTETAEGSSKKEVSEGAAQETDWWKLFFEYAIATRKYRHARINFSVHSGLNQIIAEHKNTALYKTVLKKNATSLEEKHGKWKTVCWFTIAQWKEIFANKLDVQIIMLATAENAKQLIDELLDKYRIPPSIENQAAAAKLEAILNVA